MNNEKFNLLISNSEELNNVGSLFTVSSFRRCAALTLTLKNKKADSSRINEAIDLIKKNTSLLSNFRGNNLISTAIAISVEDDMNMAFKEIESIYLKLKTVFRTSEYLVMASQVIYNARNRVNVDKAVKDTRTVYDYMKKNNFFLTGGEDISAAAMIATTTNNIEMTAKEMKEYYLLLKENGFRGGNNLQSLSHMLVLFKGSANEKVEKVAKLRNTLTRNRVNIKSHTLPILAVVAFSSDDYENSARWIKEVYQRLREEKGFGTFSVEKSIVYMIAAGIVAASNIEKLDERDMDNLVNTTNNIALTIQIATEVAATSAAAAAVATSVATTSN